jgi:phage tail tape-measure protein
MTGAAIEAADGIGRLSAIGLGATEGAAMRSAFGPLGTAIGGIIGGFIGNAGWEYTGGAINESSRQMHDQARQQADQVRQGLAPTRPAGGGGSGSCTCR